jgi:serine/threonine-protein kinase
VLFCPQDGGPTREILTGAGSGGDGNASPDSNTVIADASPAVAERPKEADAFIGKTVGNFKLTKRLGMGAMGAVYEAVHPIVGIRVAVKILGGSVAFEQDLVERFFSEARALNQVAHENIVKVVDLGTHPDGFYYCVMELLEGETLTAVLRYGRLDVTRGLFILTQICDGLAAAHDKGVIHRDLKPANVMVVRHPTTGLDVVKIVDFGIAKLQTAQPQANATSTGMIIGTPAYMSPEQAAGRTNEIDARSDLYSLGLVAYELFTGRHPYEGRPVGELIVAQITEVPKPPSTFATLPRRLDTIIQKLLRKRKEERFASASALAFELRGLMEDLRAGQGDLAAAAGPAAAPPKAPGMVPSPLAPASAAVPTGSAPPVMMPAAARVPTGPPPVLPPAPSPPPVRVHATNGIGVPATPAPVAAPPTPPRAPAPAPPAAASGPPPSRMAGIASASPPGKSSVQTGKHQATGKIVTSRRRTPFVRGAFVVLLTAAGGAFAAVHYGVIDLDPLFGQIASSTGVGLPTVNYGNKGRLKGDGINAAFQAEPQLKDCRERVDNMHRRSLPADPARLERPLVEELTDYAKIDECLRRHQGDATSDWAAKYVKGWVAYDFATKIDKLPKAAQQLARNLKGVDTSDAFGFALQQADEHLSEARQDAPMVHQGLIDAFKLDIDGMKQRSASEGPLGAAAIHPAPQ